MVLEHGRAEDEPKQARLQGLHDALDQGEVVAEVHAPDHVERTEHEARDDSRGDDARLPIAKACQQTAKEEPPEHDLLVYADEHTEDGEVGEVASEQVWGEGVDLGVGHRRRVRKEGDHAEEDLQDDEVAHEAPHVPDRLEAGTQPTCPAEGDEGDQGKDAPQGNAKEHLVDPKLHADDGGEELRDVVQRKDGSDGDDHLPRCLALVGALHDGLSSLVGPSTPLGNYRTSRGGDDRPLLASGAWVMLGACQTHSI